MPPVFAYPRWTTNKWGMDMRLAGLCAGATLLLSPTVFAFDDSESLDRDAVIDLVSNKTVECRKEKDQSLCSNFFSDEGVVVQVLREDGERKDGVWFVDDQERLCILWKGKIKPLCFSVYQQPDDTWHLIKNDKHITTILHTEDGNPNNL